MKIENLIVLHLFNCKKVTLQDIGTFTLAPDVVIPAEPDKEIHMPENAITFAYNKKAAADEDLINFIVAQTRKIKPLATSDLESYSILAKQFLNIGKPFPIEGLGALQKNRDGEYEFVQGTLVNAKLETAPALLKEKAEDEISFSTKAEPGPGKKKWLYVALGAIIIAVLAVVYYFVSPVAKDNTVEKVTQSNADTAVPKKDTAAAVQVAADTTPVVTQKADSINFRIVIRSYTSKETADKIFSKFTSFGHTLELQARDTNDFKITMPFRRKLADTTKTKDSLKILFGGTPYVELK